tara:strand:+ start:15031 stop:15321 length:291 start_codon:yes stop_codon:yes gene_type:complete
MLKLYVRILVLIIGLIIMVVGLTMWNTPLQESENDSVSIYSSESGLGTPRDVGYTFWGFFNCYCFGPYIVLFGMLGKLPFISTENWSFHPPEMDRE